MCEIRTDFFTLSFLATKAKRERGSLLLGAIVKGSLCDVVSSILA